MTFPPDFLRPSEDVTDLVVIDPCGVMVETSKSPSKVVPRQILQDATAVYLLAFAVVMPPRKELSTPVAVGVLADILHPL